MTQQDTKVMTVTRMPQGSTYVPGFRIAGKWLENLGFAYGDKCRISINEDGSLAITKLEVRP